jgi:hypothetical protein
MSQLLEKPAVTAKPDISDRRFDELVEWFECREDAEDGSKESAAFRDLIARCEKQGEMLASLQDSLDDARSELAVAEEDVEAVEYLREAAEGLLPTFSRLRDNAVMFAQDVRELLRRVPA